MADVQLPTRDYRLPIVALACGAAGILVPPLVLAGAVLGFVAYRRISREPDLKGRGLAIAAMAMPIVALPLYIVAGAILMVPSLR